MSFVDKFLSSMKFNDYDDEDYDDDFLDDEEDDEEFDSYSSNRKYRDEEEDEAPRKFSKVTPMRRSNNRNISAGMEVCVIKPTSMEEAREITDTLLANRTVVLNLEGLDVDVAQRIIDFTSGSTFAMRGNLQKISHCIFIVTPKSVDISGDFPELLTTGGNIEVSRAKAVNFR